MHGFEMWFIHQDRYGEKFYYKGTENRGRRVWTKRKAEAFFFTNKHDAIAAWTEMGQLGVITGNQV